MKTIGTQIQLEAMDSVSGGANPNPFDVLSGLAGVIVAIDGGGQSGHAPQAPAPSAGAHDRYSYEDDYGSQSGQSHQPNYSVAPTTHANEVGYENFHF